MSRGQAGFTLVEMLVALTLVGLLSVGLFAGLRFGARAWEATGDRIAAANDIGAARSFLRRRLAQIQPLDLAARAGEPGGPVFDGQADRLRFAAPWPLHLGHGGAFIFELRAAGDDAGGLLLDWALFRPEGPVDVAQGRQRPRRLFDGVQDVDFRYFGRSGGAREPTWHRSWSETQSLPSMVEIRLIGGVTGNWPPIRVAVAAKDAGHGGV